MYCTLARFGARFSAASALALLLSLAPAQAEEILGDRLTDQILEMNKLDLVRRLDSELERRKRELGQEQTAERANKLRELLKSRAATYESLEDFERAESDYNTMVDVKPVNPVVYSDRGYFYMRQRRFTEAVRDFTTGSRMAPAQSAFNYGAGRALSRLGDYPGAIEHYNEAIRLAPGEGLQWL